MESKNKTTSYNPTPQKILNTINLDQKQPLVENTLSRHPNLMDPPHASVSETGKMSLNNWFQKPVVFQPNLQWQTTDAVNTVLYSTTLLSILESVPTPANLSLSGNAYFRSGINIDLRVSASPFHAGKLILSYIPPGVDLTYRESVYAKAMFPSVFIDAGNNTHGMLHIPFVAIKDYFSTQFPDQRSNLGSIYVTVLNPLRIGTGGSPQVTYALSMNPTDNELAVPIKSHTVAIQGLLDFDGFDMGGLSSLLHGDYNQDFKAALNALERKTGLDKLFKDVSLAVGSDTPKIIKILKELQASNASPSVPPPAPPSPAIPSGSTIIPQTDASAPTVSNQTGLTTEHLSLIPEETDMQTKDQSVDLKEMDLRVVAKTPSLLQICNYNSTNVVSDVLFIAPVTPTLLAGTYATSGDAPVQGISYPTYLQHTTYPFAFWRGSIDFHFSFAATEQHKGKVLVAYVPNAAPASAPNDVTSLSVYPNEVFDLSMNRDFTFKVPYNTEVEYKMIDAPYIMPVDGSRPLRDKPSLYTNGTIVMVVYNRLTYPGTVTPNINFNVFISAGEDFEFHGLRDPDVNVFPVSYLQIQSSNDVIYEASLEGMKKERANVVGISDKLLSKSTFQSSDNEMKLDMLLSKYQPQYAFNLPIAANNSRGIAITITPGLIERSERVTTLSDPVFRNLISHYKQLYAFWCGSINFFIIHNSTVNNPVILSLTHIPNTHSGVTTAYPNGQGGTNGAIAALNSTNTQTPNTVIDLSLTSMYSHLSNIRVNPTVEITAPYRSSYRRLYPKITDLPRLETTSTGILFLRYTNPTADTQTVAATVFQSIGDDFRFKYLIPPLSLATTVNY